MGGQSGDRVRTQDHLFLYHDKLLIILKKLRLIGNREFNHLTIILTIAYVDDIIISDDDSKGIDEFKAFLQNSSQTQDLEKLHYFLGIEVVQFKEGINLLQRKYVLEFLEETSLLGSDLRDSNGS